VVWAAIYTTGSEKMDEELRNKLMEKSELGITITGLVNHSCLCTCGEEFPLTDPLGYEHGGGLDDKNAKNYWVYYVCPKCNYQWSESSVKNNLRRRGIEVKYPYYATVKTTLWMIEENREMGLITEDKLGEFAWEYVRKGTRGLYDPNDDMFETFPDEEDGKHYEYSIPEEHMQSTTKIFQE